MIETERLVLRRWEESDIPALSQINADPGVMEFYPKTMDADETRAMVENFEMHFELHGFGILATTLKGTGELVGFIGCKVFTLDTVFTPCIEIGWRLGSPHWGKGYAPEGAKAALDRMFAETPRLGEILSFTAAANGRSQKVMQKIGMTRDASRDFDHPLLPAGHALARHVVYAARNAAGGK